MISMEPRDRLSSSSNNLRAVMLRAAADADLEHVEEYERKLTGVARPDWETDLHVFQLRK